MRTSAITGIPSALSGEAQGYRLGTQPAAGAVERLAAAFDLHGPVQTDAGGWVVRQVEVRYHPVVAQSALQPHGFQTEDPQLRPIAEKVLAGTRLDAEEAVALYRSPDILAVGWLANSVRERLHGDKTYFNRAGVAFAPNKDGSINFKLDLFPNVTFQMRDKDEKDT